MQQELFTSVHTQESWKSARQPLPLTLYQAEETSEKLTDLLAGYQPIGLQEIEKAALFERVDTKFVMTVPQMFIALFALEPYYRVLTIKGHTINHYRTLYFDTPAFTLYNLHVNGKADRYKIRSREYIETQNSFFEVKHKTVKNRTIKDRIATVEPLYRLDRDAQTWLTDCFPQQNEGLEPKLWNTFTRITLTANDLGERVTFDTQVAFYANGKTAFLDNIVIAEVKRDKGSAYSPMMTQMRLQKIIPQSFSKYCIGVAMLYDQVKKNRLKSKLLWLEKISKGAQNE